MITTNLALYDHVEFRYLCLTLQSVEYYIKLLILSNNVSECAWIQVSADSVKLYSAVSRIQYIACVLSERQ